MTRVRAWLALATLAGAIACSNPAEKRASELRRLESLAAEADLLERAAAAGQTNARFAAEHARYLMKTLNELPPALAPRLTRVRARLEALATP